MKAKYEVSAMEDGDAVRDEEEEESASFGSAVKSTNWIVAVSVALFGLVFNGAAIGYTRYCMCNFTFLPCCNCITREEGQFGPATFFVACSR